MLALIGPDDRWSNNPQSVESLLDAYRCARGTTFSLPPWRWQHWLARARRARARRHLRKVMRTTTEFERRDRTKEVAFVFRPALTPQLEAILANLSAAMATSTVLKAGRSATVVRTNTTPSYVIKRYNPGGLPNAWRPRFASRARAAWRNGHHLCLLGIPAARPLALVEKNSGWGARVNYLVLEDHGDGLIDRHARTVGVSERLANQVGRLLLGLRRADIAHRDTKASNLLVTQQEQVVLIDLDGLRHRPGGDRRDALRFLANWTRPGDADSLARFTAALRRRGLVT
ncbi:MAG: lipopolysaccharide kinase InaA family protein [Pseudomonadales bacterium]